MFYIRTHSIGTCASSFHIIIIIIIVVVVVVIINEDLSMIVEA